MPGPEWRILILGSSQRSADPVTRVDTSRQAGWNNTLLLLSSKLNHNKKVQPLALCSCSWRQTQNSGCCWSEGSQFSFDFAPNSQFAANSFTLFVSFQSGFTAKAWMKPKAAKISDPLQIILNQTEVWFWFLSKTMWSSKVIGQYKVI